MKKRLTKKQMIIFSVGQFGWSLLGGIISAWLVTYFLPTKDAVAEGATRYLIPGLAIGGFLTIIGLITALSRIFDAVTDPLIASLSDRSTNPRGRRIPFMQIAAIPFAVITVLCGFEYYMHYSTVCSSEQVGAFASCVRPRFALL